MDVKQKIIEFLKINGPIIPVRLSKEIKLDILMTSAYLSELSSQGKVKISNIKIGGTPLYYLPGQKEALQKFSDNLHEKEKKAFEILKEKKILRDKTLDPVIRVALREIKDFAIPLQVTSQNNKEIFWKWYLLEMEEAESLTRSLLIGEEQKKKETKEESKIHEKEIKDQIKPLESKKETIKKEIIPKEKESKKSIDKTGEFLEEIKSYFSKNNINIKNIEIIRKNLEVDFIIDVPSGIGNIEYYCKAKNKKRVSEGDLSSAYVQGQIKKIPVLFLTKGELTKRAKEMVNSEFKNMNINKI